MKSQKQHDLLAGLGALASSEVPLSPMDGKYSPIADPYPSLPLWRRVDKQFWWNEWVSKPFIDAGVCNTSLALKLKLILLNSYIPISFR